MQIQFTIIADSVEEVVVELRALAEKLAGGGGAPAEEPPKAEPKKPRGRPKKEKAPEPEPEPVDEGEDVQAVGEPESDEPAGDPEKDWDLACEKLMKFYTENEARQGEVVTLLTEGFGVKRFAEVPKDKGTELLAKVNELVGDA